MRIIHTADIQVKNRGGLYQVTNKMLKKIESVLNNSLEKTIYVISGDLFEYAHVNALNDSERKLIYNHLSRVLNLNNVVEVVLLAGNHDLLKEKKKTAVDTGHNVINIFTELMKNLDSAKADKIIYCSESKVYQSKITDKFAYYVYSIEDDMKVDFTENKDQFKIVLFHDMLKEYIDSVKLPLRKDIYNKLVSVDEFPPDSLILAGDIHKNLRFDGLSNQIFYYPGSPMQHTHSEGSYITIGHNGILTKVAEPKIVNEFVVDINTDKLLEHNDFIRNEIGLSDYITYNTLTLDNKATYSDIIDALTTKELFNVGKERTIVKVKSSNVFITFENEIEQIIRKQLINSPYCKIIFDYEKFVDTTSSVLNTTVRDLVEEKQNELVADSDGTTETDNLLSIMSADNIDNLILSDVQLSKLFDSVLNSQLSNIINDDIPDSELSADIKALFAQELTKHNSTNVRYDVLFEDVASPTGFMNLAPCEIELNYPGLIRILGTNGVGKTTMYNMIRWTITGLVFPNLSKSQYIKNNLIVFNKYKPDIDTISTNLNLKVNKNIIFVERSVTRKWKNNTTVEQKSDINWKEYISTVERSFKLTVKGATVEEDKVFNGEQAEAALAKWFGNTIDTIIFMNQTSLENLLATSPLDLNNLILNFIGVDYLKKLEDGLPGVKTELLSIAKPTIDKETLRERIIDAEIAVKKQEELISNYNRSILEGNETQGIYERDLKNINNTLIDFGNVPDKITELGNTKTNLEELINSFIVKEIKPKVEFVDVKPVLKQDKIDVFTTENIGFHDDIKAYHGNIRICDDKLTQIINVDLLKIVTDSKIVINARIFKHNTKIDDTIQQINNTFKLIESYYTEYIQKLDAKDKEKSTIITELQQKVKQREIKNTEYQNQIESGVCSECKRAFDNIDEDHLKAIELKKQSNIDLNIIDNQSIDDAYVVIANVRKITLEYKGYRDLAVAQDLNIINNESIIKQQTSSITMLKDFMKIKMDTNTCKDIDMSMLANIDLLYNKVQLGTITDDDKGLTELEIFSESISLLETIYTDNTKNNNNIEIANDKIASNLSAIDVLKTTYQNALTVYNDNLLSNVEANKLVDTYNIDVDSHNNKKYEYNVSLSQTDNSLTKLLLNDLPLYNKEVMRKFDVEKLNTELKKLIESSVERRAECQLNIVTYQNTFKEAKRLLDECMLYQKNNLIWKIYSKLIKKQFKDIVFQYYRTFLNNTLNEILSDVNFKLFWNDNSELIHVSYQNAQITYQLVQQSSGMETCFLSLALVYTMHLLNVKNTISHIFIDEISGTLNEGKNLSYDAENYKELLVLILSKFTDKTIFIIDHNIDNLFESVTYEVIPGTNESTFTKTI